MDKIETLKILMELLDDSTPKKSIGEPMPVVIWTDKRGVIFGYTADPDARPITLTDARMCLYWDKTTGGVFGLCDKGPNEYCKISARLPQAVFEGVTGVAKVTDDAEAAWNNAPTQGRD